LTARDATPTETTEIILTASSSHHFPQRVWCETLLPWLGYTFDNAPTVRAQNQIRKQSRLKNTPLYSEER